MLTDQRIGIEIAKAFVHRGRTLEVGEQQGHLPDSEPFLLVDAFGPEQAPESLPGKQHPAGHVGLEVERRLDRQRHDFGRPIDQEQRAARGPGVLHLDDDGTRRQDGQRRKKTLPVISDPQTRRRRRGLAGDRHHERGLRLDIDARQRP